MGVACVWLSEEENWRVVESEDLREVLLTRRERVRLVERQVVANDAIFVFVVGLCSPSSLCVACSLLKVNER